MVDPMLMDAAPTAPTTDAVTFADATARAELEGHLSLLADPARHEEPRVARVKHNATRTVWRAQLDGSAVYIKHFHAGGAVARLKGLLRGSDARRELAFSRHLRGAGVEAIEVLAIGEGKGRAWVVSRAVEPAEPLDAWHERVQREGHAGPRLRSATRALAELVGRMHLAGVRHLDLHSGNILVQEEGGVLHLVLTDLHRVTRRRRLTRRGRAKDLALLLHDRLHATGRAERVRFLARYLAVTGGPGTLRGWRAMVEPLAQAHSASQYAARDRRVLGENRYFTRLRLGHWRGHAVLASKRRPLWSPAAGMEFTPADWQEALADPEALLTGPGGEVVKDSPSSLVVRRRLRVGGQEVDVHLKRHRRKRPWKAPLDLFRTGRAMRAFRNGHALITRRVPTALPLAVLEQRTGPWLRDSVLIVETVEPGEPLRGWLSRRLEGEGPGGRHRLAHALLGKLGALLRRLHEAGYAHRDLKGSNLLVHGRPGAAPEVVLIDLDGMSRPRRLSRRQIFQGLMRLNVSLLECPAVTHAGRLRMLLGYLRRPGSGRVAYKPYWRELEAWSARKLRRQIAGRQKKQRRLRRPRA